MTQKDFKIWLREKREMIAVVLAMLLILISIILGLLIRQSNSNGTDDPKPGPPERVRMDVDSKQGGEGSAQQTTKKTTASFFLKPSPGEVLDIIKELGDAELPVANQKYTGLRVMWPVYFFQILSQESDRARVLLDVTEDGFGVTIETEIDITQFPEILETERGRKIWVAGEIQGVDITGTGRILMLTEEVRFQEGLLDAIKGLPPKTPAPQQEVMETSEPAESTKVEEGPQ
jgi:hypothetical protein